MTARFGSPASIVEAVDTYAERVLAAETGRARVLLENLARLARDEHYPTAALHARMLTYSRALGRIDQRRDARNIGSRVAYLAGRMVTAGSGLNRDRMADVIDSMTDEIPAAVKGAHR